MKLRLAFVAVFAFSFSSCLYTYHAYTKKEVIKTGNKLKKKNKENVQIEENPNKVKLMVRDKRYHALDEIYEFDDKGKQLKYSLVSYCDSCFQKYLTKIVSTRLYKWTPLNDSTYLAAYHAKTILNIHEYKLSFDLITLQLNKKEYNELKHKKKL